MRYTPGILGASGLLLAVLAAACAGVFCHPQAHNRAGGGQACALAPQLEAARLSAGFPGKKQPVRLLIDGQPPTNDSLLKLRGHTDQTRLEVEIGGERIPASHIGNGGYGAAFRFRYEGADYVLKVPGFSDTCASNLHVSLHRYARIDTLLDWMDDHKYLTGRYTEPWFQWTARGREAVLGEAPDFYAGVADVLSGRPAGEAGRTVPTYNHGTAPVEQAVHDCRHAFQKEMPGSLAAWHDARGSALAYGVPFETLIPLPGLPGLLAPCAVVRRYLPSDLTLEDIRKTRPWSLRVRQARAVARSAVAELARTHTDLNLAHGDVKPSNLAIEAGGRVRLIDWGLSRTPAQLRDGACLTYTRDFATPARAAGRPYNAFFDDYYGLALSLAQAWTAESPGLLFAQPARTPQLNEQCLFYKILVHRLPLLPERIRVWRNRGRPDIQAFTLAMLEACEAGDLPAYLVWGDPDRLYLSVEEIEREAAHPLLGAAA